MPTKYAMRLAYEGTDFCGWQIQKGKGRHENALPSIEGTVTAAISELCGEPITLVSSGRTDAGVHASGQVAHFSLKEERPEVHFADGINAILPPSIRILIVRAVPDSFRAQRSQRKQYSYYFQQGPAPLPHLTQQTFWNRYPLDIDAMNRAVEALQGEHDFQGFCGAGAQVSSTVRVIHEASVKAVPIPEPGNFASDEAFLVRLRLCGNGFLKQMVRNIAGTLRQIGEGRRPEADMAAILASKDRRNAGPTASPSGLWLDRVWYEESESTAFLNRK